MVNGAPGSAWSSILVRPRSPTERLLAGSAALDAPAPLGEHHLFDIASLTKLFTAVAALSLVEDGRLDLDAPVAETLPVGSGDPARRITARHLLTHSSGLPATSDAWRAGLTGDALLDRTLAARCDSLPGFAHLYSCVGYVALGRLLEELDDRPLDTLIRTRVLDPLGAATATFRPSAISATVATETQLHRGPVRGQVHDELAHAIGRPVGNAGMFATAEDVLTLGSMVLNGGAGRARRVLSAESVKLLSEPVIDADNYHQAIGFRVGDDRTMGRIQGIGHTGFTGTSLVIAPHSGGTAVLLTNRVHPTRFDADITTLRRSFAERLEQPVADPWPR
ncbi:serine hydrolase domain-containing protein [Streptomyces niveus]|uniref:serine hydrolase domain-containing protein n=1 Tax=Streptomyces niveus TaxID=193462 RepID=UPI00371E9BFF